MVRLEEHLFEIRIVFEELKNTKKGTCRYRDLSRRYKRMCQERSEALQYLKEAKRL